jgi:hypothetical protein
MATTINHSAYPALQMVSSRHHFRQHLLSVKSIGLSFTNAESVSGLSRKSVAKWDCENQPTTLCRQCSGSRLEEPRRLNLSLRYDIYILSKGQVTKRIDSPEECPPCIEGRLTPNHPVSLNLEPAIKITSVNPSTAYLPVDTTIHLPTRSSLIAHRGKKARSIRVETMN